MTPNRREQFEKQTQSRFVSGFLLLCVLFVIAGIGWNYLYGPCGVVQVDRASDVLSHQLQTYQDAYNIAASTERSALAEPVADLQMLQRETEAIQVPACLETAKSELLLSIDAAARGFLALRA